METIGGRPTKMDLSRFRYGRNGLNALNKRGSNNSRKGKRE